MIGIIHHELFFKHLEGFPHVERPERLTAIVDRIKTGPLSDTFPFIEAVPAESTWLTRVHDPEYVDSILTLGGGDPIVLDWGDTVATDATPKAALYAAGSGVQGTRLILNGILRSAFCAVRPPGHHAERNRAMGFCIFNNVAIAAADLLEQAGLARVAIVDWDVHHGNGTERTFAEDDRVLYISLHQFPHYPGTGNPEMRGRGRGIGYTLNIPLGTGAGDDEYRQAFTEQVIPALDEFAPEFILISAGFDAHRDDPLSGTNVTSAFFGEMTHLLVACAERHCRGRILSMLEGGYDLPALAESVEYHLTALAGR
jgi:acetoin utilization deacetylase AcuC-like enzyme